MSSGFALFAPEWPQDLLAALLVVTFVLASGLAMSVAVARRLRLGWPAAIAGAFAVSSALAAAVALAGSLVGAPLEAGVAAFTLASAALTWWGTRLMRGQPALELDAPGLAIGGLAAFFALFERPWFKISADSFYHVAAARSLLTRDALVVTDPFHGTGITVPDPSSGVLHTMMAFVARLTGMDMAALFSGWTVLGALVLALAFHALARRVTPVRWAAAVATAGYLVAGWYLDFRAAGYPNRVSIALILLGVLALTEAFEKPSVVAATAVATVLVATSAMHVGNAEFLFIAGAAVALMVALDALAGRRIAGAWKLDGVVAVLGGLVAGAVASLPFLLPKFGVVSASSMVGTSETVSTAGLVHLGPLVVADPGALFQGGALAFALTTALAGWAAFAGIVRRDRVATCALAVAALPALVLTDPPVTTLAVTWSSYNFARIAALLGFTAYVAAAWGLGRWREGRAGGWGAAAGAVLLAATLVVSTPYLLTAWTSHKEGKRPGMSVPVWDSRNRDIRRIWGEHDVARLRVLLGQGYPVVAADEGTGYYLSALVSVRLLAAPASHSPLAVEVAQGAERRAAVYEILDQFSTEAERRAVLDRWGVDYVFLWTSRPREYAAALSMRDQPALFEEVGIDRRLVVFRVRR